MNFLKSEFVLEVYDLVHCSIGYQQQILKWEEVVYQARFLETDKSGFVLYAEIILALEAKFN